MSIMKKLRDEDKSDWRRRNEEAVEDLGVVYAKKKDSLRSNKRLRRTLGTVGCAAILFGAYDASNNGVRAAIVGGFGAGVLTVSELGGRRREDDLRIGMQVVLNDAFNLIDTGTHQANAAPAQHWMKAALDEQTGNGALFLLPDMATAYVAEHATDTDQLGGAYVLGLRRRVVSDGEQPGLAS